MRRNKLSGVLLLALLSLAFASTALALPPDRLDSARTVVSRLTRSLVDQDRKIAETSRNLDRISAEIHSLKRAQTKETTVLRQYRLQARLQEAQEISDHLADATDERQAVTLELRLARTALAVELDRAIAVRRTIANSNAENWKTRSASAHELDRLLLERMQLSIEPTEGRLPSDATPLLRGESSREEAADRLNALRDLEKRMEDEISILKGEVAEARRQQFLRNELSHLMDEESFFAEQGFVRGGAGRTPGALAALKTGTAASPAAAGSPVAGTAPGQDVPVAASPGTADARSKVPLSPTDLDPTSHVSGPAADAPLSDKGARDPLAQLASEFGLPLDQKRDVQGRNPASTDQVQWLENRISVIRAILNRLHQRARELAREASRL
ncbi:MAG: hypothetical protein V1495_08655 [Pseudomonadota bacterium]